MRHPLGERDKLGVLKRWLYWQLKVPSTQGNVPWIAGARLLHRRGKNGISGNYYLGLHEFSDMAFFMHYLRAEDLFLDVGANAGSFSLMVAATAGSQIVAFEPDLDCFALLEAQCALNHVEGIELHSSAVGARCGEVRFSVLQDALGHIVSEHSHEAFRMVPLVSLDSALNARRVQAIKIDVEGGELDVLEGAHSTLGQNHPMAVQVEVASSERGQAVFSRMTQLGFEQRHYDPWTRELTVEPNQLPASNLLFVRDAEFAQLRLRSAPSFDVFGQRV